MKIVSFEDAIRRYIVGVLEITDWRVKGPGGAAELLELPPSTLYSKMKKLGIKRKTVPNKRSRSNKQ